VTEDYEALGFNTAISQMMICLNQLSQAKAITRDAAETFLKLLAPLAPHITEELWERLGNAPGISKAPWPVHDEAKLQVSTVKIIFQVNGKHRGDALLPADVSKEDAIAAARADARVIAHTEGKEIRREIYVPGKIVNIVAN